MSDESRTQAPSKRRRQEARARGQVARSPELTATVGLLTSLALLSFWGGDLVSALIVAVREPWVGEPALSADPAEVIARLRHSLLGVGLPLAGILGGVAAATVAAHQAQVMGLWAPGLLAPDWRRLWTGGGLGESFMARSARGAWSLAKAAVILAVSAALIRSNWPRIARIGELETAAMAVASAALLRDLTLALAASILALGVVDLLLQRRKFEALLSTTPEENREEQKAIEGDPSLRARRNQAARRWRIDPAEILADAALLVTGQGGLTVLVAGGPPPRKVRVAHIARGASATRIRAAAGRSQLPRLEAPELARRLTQRPKPGSALSAEILAELAANWPPAANRGGD